MHKLKSAVGAITCYRLLSTDYSSLERQLEPILNFALDVTGTLADDFAEVRVIEIHNGIVLVDLIEGVVGFDVELEFIAITMAVSVRNNTPQAMLRERPERFI